MMEGTCERTHQATEPLERPWNPDMGIDLDEDALRGVDVDLQEARLVQGRVQQRQKALGRVQSSQYI